MEIGTRRTLATWYTLKRFAEHDRKRFMDLLRPAEDDSRILDETQPTGGEAPSAPEGSERRSTR